MMNWAKMEQTDVKKNEKESVLKLFRRRVSTQVLVHSIVLRYHTTRSSSAASSFTIDSFLHSATRVCVCMCVFNVPVFMFSFYIPSPLSLPSSFFLTIRTSSCYHGQKQEFACTLSPKQKKKEGKRKKEPLTQPRVDRTLVSSLHASLHIQRMIREKRE